MVDRYEVESSEYGGVDTLRCKDGQWVDYDDYEELNVKYQKLCELVMDCWREID